LRRRLRRLFVEVLQARGASSSLGCGKRCILLQNDVARPGRCVPCQPLRPGVALARQSRRRLTAISRRVSLARAHQPHSRLGLHAETLLGPSTPRLQARRRMKSSDACNRRQKPRKLDELYGRTVRSAPMGSNPRLTPSIRVDGDNGSRSALGTIGSMSHGWPLRSGAFCVIWDCGWRQLSRLTPARVREGRHRNAVSRAVAPQGLAALRPTPHDVLARQSLRRHAPPGPSSYPSSSAAFFAAAALSA
jgi:hypothetical protein